MKLNHASVSEIPVDAIRPAEANVKIYKPVDPSDPDVQALAKDIRKNGILQPLTITREGILIDGHRRHLAARLAGLSIVPCRFIDIDAGDFERVLVSFNRQRVKSITEMAREEAALLDPADTRRRYMARRDERQQRQTGTILLGEKKTRSIIGKGRRQFLDATQRVIDANKEFWPLSVRQVHYGLLNNPPLIHANKLDSRYGNNANSYNNLTRLLTQARLEGHVPFDALEDTTRPVETWDAFDSVQPFIRRDLDWVFSGYRRNLQQSQSKHVEVIVEKNTVAKIIRPVAQKYNLPFTSARGYPSLPAKKAIADRFRISGKQELVLLIASDLDPEGEDIARDITQSMRDKFAITNVTGIKVALTPEQIQQLNVQPNMQVKLSSTRAKKFIELHGSNVYELEAIPPRDLQRLVKSGINNVLDLQALNREIEIEAYEQRILEGLRITVQKAVGGFDEMEGV